MGNETQNEIQTTSAAEPTNEQYIEALAEMRKNSVSREDYNKIKQENAQLLNTLVNGGSISPESVPQKRSIDECRKVIFSDNTNNLEFAKASLELRAQLIEKGEPDPFLPYGQKIVPTEEDVATANRVATALQECIEYANGDSNIFTNELMRRTVDVAPPTRRGR